LLNSSCFLYSFCIYFAIIKDVSVPTFGIPKEFINLDRGIFFDLFIALIIFSAFFSANFSNGSKSPFVNLNRSLSSSISPFSNNWLIMAGPIPSILKHCLLTKYSILLKILEKQFLFVQ